MDKTVSLVYDGTAKELGFTPHGKSSNMIHEPYDTLDVDFVATYRNNVIFCQTSIDTPASYTAAASSNALRHVAAT